MFTNGVVTVLVLEIKPVGTHQQRNYSFTVNTIFNYLREPITAAHSRSLLSTSRDT